jgi:predicted ester cyclase
MSDETLKNMAVKYFDYLDRRNLDGLGSLFATNAKFYGFVPQALDVEGTKVAMSALYSAFPDSRMPTDDIIVEGNRIAIRHSFRGTHKAPFQNIPATGNSVVVTAIVILTIENDKIVEAWLNADFFGLLQQLGVIPQAA